MHHWTIIAALTREELEDLSKDRKGLRLLLVVVVVEIVVLAAVITAASFFR